MSFNSPFFIAFVLAVASILLVGLMEVLADRRFAVLAVLALMASVSVACCVVIQV